MVERAYLGVTVPLRAPGRGRSSAQRVHPSGDVAQRMDIDPGRIMLVPPGVDRRGPGQRPRWPGCAGCYGLGDRPFFLYPTITYPHKNHVSLIRAFAAWPPPIRSRCSSSPAAPVAPEPEVRGEIERQGLGERVVRAGRVPRPDLDALFDAAAALTFPSHYEGFGIPVLEAMSHRLPVLASSSTALPEVVGDGGVLLDPDDIEAWAEAMADIVNDPAHRAELSRRAEARAAGYTWEASAQALAAVYRVARLRVEAGPHGKGGGVG